MNDYISPDKARAIALDMASKLTDEALCLAWNATEVMRKTQEVGLTRAWLMEELANRLGEDLYDAWLMDPEEDDEPNDPAAYFERKRLCQ